MNTSFAIHPEDIKAAIRKAHGSLAAFERNRGLSARSVTDVLIGRVARPTAEVIAKELGHSVETLFPGIYTSAVADDTPPARRSHRLNAEAR